MSTTSWPASTVWAPLTAWAPLIPWPLSTAASPSPRSRLTAGSATAENRSSSRTPPASRRCLTTGGRRDHAPAARPVPGPSGPFSMTNENPRRCSAPAADPRRSSSGMASRRTPAVVTPRASATPPRNPAHQSSSGSRGRRAAPPGASARDRSAPDLRRNPPPPGARPTRTRPSVPPRPTPTPTPTRWGAPTCTRSAASEAKDVGTSQRPSVSGERPAPLDAVASRWWARPSASSSSRSDGKAWSIRPSCTCGRPAVSARTRPCRYPSRYEAVWTRGAGSAPGPSRTSPRRSRRRRPARHHPGATCRHPRAVRKRWSPLATSSVPSARVTRCAGLRVDQCARTSVATYRRAPSASTAVPTTASPGRRSAIGRERPSASSTRVAPSRQ